MRGPLRCIVLLFALIFSRQVFAQATIQKPGSWVSETVFDITANPKEEQSSSTYYLLADDQENTLLQEHYLHFVYKILTNEGVQEMSDLSFDFDPAYQKLILHSLKIFRDGKEINHLKDNYQIIQREESMDRFLYDGSKTVVFNLKDIRKGDVIEYAFTRKGYNPAYADHVSRSIYFEYTVPIDKIFKRIILSSAKKLTEKFADGELKPDKKIETGNQIDYSWTILKSEGSEGENNVPDWYDGSRRLMITDFSSWNEVATAVSKLFVVSEDDKNKLKEAISSIKLSTESDEKYTLDAIRFVQDEIRYLGFETGLNSHKPHSPIKIYDQRFGDCKDKSLLLSSILNLKGIEAYPVLVNTNMRDHLMNELPSMTIFNHCVVKIQLGIKTLYVDPTINNQGGNLDKIFFPNYGVGLIVHPGSHNLETFPALRTSTITEIQTFDVLTIGGEAILTIHTSYTGNEADYQRGEFASKDRETIEKNYLKYYANLYPDITKWESVKVDDNRADNVFIVEEKYKIPTFWTPYKQDEGDDIISCKVYPQTLESYFSLSKAEQQRKTPYRLTYPIDYYHTTHLQLPEQWTVQPEELVLGNDHYLIDYSVNTRNNEITRHIHYQTKKDHIPLEMIKTYLADHEKMYNQLSYVLTYNKKIVAASKEPNYLGVIVTILSLGLSGWLILYLYRHYNPHSFIPEHNGIPIGGWLILVGIGVVVGPIRIMYDLATNLDLINGSGWKVWWLAGNIPYFAFAFFTHVYNLASVLFGLLVAVLFFQRRSSFPRLFSIYLACNAITLSADTIVASAVDNSSMDLKDMIRAIVGAAIWIPYVNISERAKETFVTKSEYYEEKETSEPLDKVAEETPNQIS